MSVDTTLTKSHLAEVLASYQTGSTVQETKQETGQGTAGHGDSSAYGGGIDG